MDWAFWLPIPTHRHCLYTLLSVAQQIQRPHRHNTYGEYNPSSTLTRNHLWKFLVHVYHLQMFTFFFFFPSFLLFPLISSSPLPSLFINLLDLRAFFILHTCNNSRISAASFFHVHHGKHRYINWYSCINDFATNDFAILRCFFS